LASLTDITVMTDNSAVLFYKKWVPQTPRLKRIICYLQQFSFDIRHIAGCKNVAADCLSRIYDDMECTDRVEMRRIPDKEEFLVVADQGQDSVSQADHDPIRDAPLTSTRTNVAAQTDDTHDSVTAEQTEQCPCDAPSDQPLQPDDDGRLDELEQKPEARMSVICDDAEAAYTENDYLEDSEFGDLYRYLKYGTLTGNDKTDRTIILSSEFYFLRKSRAGDTDLLYKIRAPQRRGAPPLTLDRLCVPKKGRAEILFRVHDVCVHSGRSKTFLSASNCFYWKTLFGDIHLYVKTCDLCQRSRRNFAHRVQPLHSLEVPDRPFSHISLDFKTLTRRTKQGNVAILVCVCQFSFYPYLIPCKDMTALTTAKALCEHVIPNEGIPRILNSDRGINFTSDLFKYLARFLNIHHRISSSKNARSNGISELVIQRMSAMLKRYEADDLELEECLPQIALALRASSLTTMPYSPFEITRGRRMYIGGPLDESTPVPYDGHIGRYIKAFRREINVLHANVEKAKIELKRQDEIAYNKLHKAKQTVWKVGDRVLLSDRTVKAGTNKILTKRPHVGPFYISEVVEGTGFGPTYRLIEEKTGRTYKYLINHDRLKRYFDSTAEMQGRLTQPPKRVPLRPMDQQLVDETSEQTPHDGQRLGDDTNNTTDDTEEYRTDSDSQQYGLEPVKCIKKQRRRRGKIEYLCEFDEGSLWWCSEVSEPLLKAWRLKQARERAKKARKRRQQMKL